MTRLCLRNSVYECACGTLSLTQIPSTLHKHAKTIKQIRAALIIYTPRPPHICPRSHQRPTLNPRMPPNSFGDGCVPRSPIQSEACLNIAGYINDLCSRRLGAHSAQLVLSIIATLTTTHEAIYDPHGRLTVSLLTFNFIRSVRRRKRIGWRKNEKTKMQAGL